MLKTILRISAKTMAVILVLAGLVALVIANRFHASLPQTEGTLQLAGLQQETQIIRDNHGIPHIFADTDHDAYFSLGVAHAQDRLWQMEITRRAIRGRLSEFLGPVGTETDIFFRTMGLGQAADEAVSNLPQDVQLALQSYANGVNSIIESPGFIPPPEYQILMFEPEAWTPGDTVVVFKAIALDLFGNAFQEPARAALVEALGEERVVEFLGRYPDDAPRSLTMEDIAMESSNTQPIETPATVGPEDIARDGSNNWVLSADRTTTGAPILANDPHLALRAPAIWYLARISTPEGSVVGVTLPGTPFVTLGRNDHIAWGFTNTGPDVGDLHAVTQDAVTNAREEIIKVRLGGDIVLTRQETETGPVLDPQYFDYPIPEGFDFFALQWMLDEADDTTPGVGMDIIHGEDWDDFVYAIRNFVAPQQNMVFADVDGDIGFYAPSRIPVRDESGHWVSTIPFEQLPNTLNPERGFIATANNKIVPDEYPHFITNEWYGVSRIRRIYDGIEATPLHDLDTMAALQLDTISDMALRILPVLKTAIPQTGRGQEALDRLSEWDGDMVTDKAEPLIYAAWVRELNRQVYEDELGEQFDNWYGDRRLFMMDVLTGELAHWCDDVSTETTETCHDLLGPTLDSAISGLIDDYGSNMSDWRWGDAHFARHAHSPFSDFPVLNRFFTIETPVPGDGATVNVAHYRFRSPGYSVFHGVSYRSLYDMSDLDRSRYMITTGQSGNVMSRHYDDLAPMWGRGEYVEIPTSWTHENPPEGYKVLTLQPG